MILGSYQKFNKLKEFQHEFDFLFIDFLKTDHIINEQTIYFFQKIKILVLIKRRARYKGIIKIIII